MFGATLNFLRQERKISRLLGILSNGGIPFPLYVYWRVSWWFSVSFFRFSWWRD